MNRLPGALRFLFRSYPFSRGKTRITQMLDKVLSLDNYASGQVIHARTGILVRLHSDPVYRLLSLFGDYEPAHTELFEKLIRRGDTAFDVGANFGWYTVNFARWVGAGGRVHAFEPLPFLVQIAEDTINLNKLTNRVITLNNIGLGSLKGAYPVYAFPGKSHGFSSFSSFGRPDARPHPCLMTTLDSYVREHDVARIDLMKLDVEGYEYDVFQGGREVLNRPDAPVIAFEIDSGMLGYRNIRPVMLQNILRECGYTDFWVITPPRGALKVAGDLPELCFGNYIAVKPRDVSRVSRAVTELNSGSALWFSSALRRNGRNE